MSVLDTLALWMSTGPGAPMFALPFVEAHEKVVDFGDPASDGAVHDRMEIRLATADALAAPVNGLLRRVPDETALLDEERRRFRSSWPTLRLLDGTALVPGDGSLLQQNDLLLEMWGSAFRRLESMYAAMGSLLPGEDEDRPTPRMPVPRYFWFRGASAPAVNAAVDDIIEAQFPESPPSRTPFDRGQTAVYVPAGPIGGVLASLGADEVVQIRAFDSDGLIVDPAAVFAMFATIAQHFDRFALPNATTLRSRHDAWVGQFPQRHTIVFSAPRGETYVPWTGDPPTVPPEPPADRALSIDAQDSGSVNVTVPEQGVVRWFSTTPEYATLNGHVAELDLSGHHTRVGLHPHGLVGDRLTTEFVAGSSFHRIRVIDYARWFPVNANPLNTLERYTEGNEYVPLIDAKAAFREIYRTIRLTHRDETYADDAALPEGTPRPPPGPTDPPGRIYNINCWIAPFVGLMGDRAMLPTPRVQTTGYKPRADLASLLQAVPLAYFPGDEPPPDAFEDTFQRDYYVVPEPTTEGPPVEAGVYAEIRQAEIGDAFQGENPWYPGADFGDDIYGKRVAKFADKIGRSFVGTQGQCALKARFDPTWERRAVLRVVTWEAEPDDSDPTSSNTAGKGIEKHHSYGEIVLPSPGEVNTSGLATANRAELLWQGTTGQATVRVPVGLVIDRARRAYVMNSRTGEWTTQDIVPGAPDTLFTLNEFANGDKALLFFGETTAPNPADADDPSDATVVFELTPSRSQIAAGAAPRHRAQVAGAFRDAIQADVDVRVLAWWDDLKPPEERAEKSGAMRAIVNATLDGRRGQSMLDTLTRESLVHHQKALFVKAGIDPVAIVGGVDMSDGRYDDPAHREINPDRPGGNWHDVHCKIRGPAAWDVYRNFRDRWNGGYANASMRGDDPGLTEVPAPTQAEIDATPRENRYQTVQINRTIPSRVPEYASFVQPNMGDRSCRAAYERLIGQARDLIYIEEQYLWHLRISTDPPERLFIPELLNARLVANRDLRLILVLTRQLQEIMIADLVLYATRRRAINAILYGKPKLEAADGDGRSLPGYVGDRVVIFHLKNDRQEPVYVHTKSWVVDDVWMTIGTPNITRRSLTYDSEITAACIDQRVARGGHQTARDYRVALLAEHLGLRPEERPLVEHPRAAFEYVRRTLAGEVPQRPQSHVMAYDPLHTQYGIQPPDLDPLYEEGLVMAIDPDGDAEAPRLPFAGLKSLIDHWAASDDPDTVGNVAALRVLVNDDAHPGDNVVTIDVAPTASPSSIVTYGPFPADAPVQAGFGARGTSYTITGRLAAASDPATTIATATTSITPSDFIAEVTLLFA